MIGVGKGNGRKAKADQTARWSDERMTTRSGYVKLRVGRDHPLADPNGYAYEHLVVWCSAGRPRPARNEILHHRNECRSDNRIGNLELLTRAEHNRLHNASRTRDHLGRLLPKAA